MTTQLEVRAGAELDLVEAALWYEAERTGLGAEYHSEIERLLRRISDNPRQFGEIDPGVRRALARRFPYAVYFLIEGDRATVLAVLHMRRHPDTWRGRLAG